MSLSPWPATADLVAETFTSSEIALRIFISEINSFGKFFASGHACIVREPFFPKLRTLVDDYVRKREVELELDSCI